MSFSNDTDTWPNFKFNNSFCAGAFTKFNLNTIIYELNYHCLRQCIYNVLHIVRFLFSM